TDQTSPSTLTGDPALFTPGGLRSELFNWDKDYLALRVWFVWLNTRIPRDHKVATHEVPDSERFDFLIRKKNGKIPLACTDLHWREMWGVMTDMPIKAKVGLTFRTLVRAGGYEIPAKLVGGPNLPYDLLLGFVQREAESFAKLDDKNEKREVLTPGLQAHVPSLDNVDHSPTLTSRDVRYE